MDRRGRHRHGSDERRDVARHGQGQRQRVVANVIAMVRPTRRMELPGHGRTTSRGQWWAAPVGTFTCRGDRAPRQGDIPQRYGGRFREVRAVIASEPQRYRLMSAFGIASQSSERPKWGALPTSSLSKTPIQIATRPCTPNDRFPNGRAGRAQTALMFLNARLRTVGGGSSNELTGSPPQPQISCQGGTSDYVRANITGTDVVSPSIGRCGSYLPSGQYEFFPFRHHPASLFEKIGAVICSLCGVANGVSERPLCKVTWIAVLGRPVSEA